MKILTETEMKRLDACYDALDLCYGTVRAFTAQQRKTFTSGELLIQNLCESSIRIHSLAIQSYWAEINSIIKAAQDAPTADSAEEPAPAPVKTVLQ